MRCRKCKYMEFDYSENCSVCGIFGWDSDEFSENRKGEEGCRYNGVTLDKYNRINLASISGLETDPYVKQIIEGNT